MKKSIKNKIHLSGGASPMHICNKNKCPGAIWDRFINGPCVKFSPLLKKWNFEIEQMKWLEIFENSYPNNASWDPKLRQMGAKRSWGLQNGGYQSGCTFYVDFGAVLGAVGALFCHQNQRLRIILLFI